MARLGLQKQWKCVWSNDNNPRKVAIYEHNFGEGHIDSRDVAVVAEGLELGQPATSGGAPNFPLGVHMAWASFPCQDLSLAGWQRGMSAERSGAYWPFWKILYYLHRLRRRPPIIVIENVNGLLYGEGFQGMCESLAALGMRFGAFMANAKDFVPQSRQRVFAIAVDSDIDLTDLALPDAPTNSWFPAAVKHVYSNLPRELQDLWTWWNVGPVSNRHTTISDIFIENPTDVQYHTQEQTQHLLSLMTPLHIEKVNTAKKVGSLRVGFLYKRTRNGKQRAEVRFDDIAGCLRTPKGGSSRQTVVVVKNGRVRTRLLSRIEAARLMGIPLDTKGCSPGTETSFFPEGFSYNDAYMAMGDGVVVPVVEHLDTTLLSELARRSTVGESTSQTTNATQSAQDDQFLKKVNKHIADWTLSEN